MSNFKVPYTTILEVSKHPNADALDMVKVYDFTVIVKKDSMKVGDNIIYCPIDSVLPQWLHDTIFPEGSKIKLTKNRIRQIRIRGLASQGMIIHPDDVHQKFHHGFDESFLEVDIAEDLGITKYEPPVPEFQKQGMARTPKKLENSKFSKYNGVENVKWYPNLFAADEEVVIQEKLHGSLIRFGRLPTEANTLWKKVLQFFNRMPKNENVYGSNNVDLTNRAGFKGYYGEDVYGKTLDKMKAFDMFEDNVVFYAELIGPGIQKNYDYGLKEHKIVVYDVKVYDEATKTLSWMNPEDARMYAITCGFEFVPVLYTGIWDKNQAYELTKGPSVYAPSQKVREGVVIKSRMKYNYSAFSAGKKAVKFISEAYLDDKSNTDNH